MVNLSRRLINHPHVRIEDRIEIVPTPRFTCALCGEDWWLNRLRGARVLPDGRLACSNCTTSDLVWCPACDQGLPPERFVTVTARTDFFGREYERRVTHTHCADCRNPQPRTPSRIAFDCQHCGAPFVAQRSDAKFCSTRCRTAAHRAAKGDAPEVPQVAD